MKPLNASAARANSDDIASGQQDASARSSRDGVKLSILGKDFFVACEEDQRESLNAAGRHLDAQMRQIRDSGKVLGPERCAIMAALNLSYELLGLRDQVQDVTGTQDRLRQISEKIDAVMEDTQQIAL